MVDGEPAGAVEYVSHDGVRMVPQASEGDLWFDAGLDGSVLTIECADAQRVLGFRDSGDGVPAALEGFVDAAAERMEESPDLHMYHFGRQARDLLCEAAQRYGSCEEILDEWLREGRFVDLEVVLARSFRVSGDPVEPLATPLRDGASGRVRDMGEWIRPFAESLRILDALDSAGEFNDWVERWAEDHSFGHDELVEGLPDAGLTPQQQGRALVHAALSFFWREDMARRWRHLRWVDAAPRHWDEDFDVLTVVEADTGAWVPKRTNYHRASVLSLTHGGVAEYDPGSRVRLVYDRRVPGMAGACPGGRGWTEAVVVSHRGPRLEVKQELLGMDYTPPDGLPVAVLPSPTVHAGPLAESVRRLAWEWEDALPHAPDGALVDLVLRRSPRLSGGGLPRTRDAAADVEAAVRRLDGSYVAVQGPPGSGKTRLAACVIASLVHSGWRVGVVAQSHRAVENVLDAALEAGLRADVVAKEPKQGTPHRPYHRTRPERWLQGRRGGALVAGTAWQFSRAGMQPGLPLDLLVIDEAGSFPLGYAISLWHAARNILLVGDAGQLQPISDGVHPQPLGASVLEWLAEGREFLPQRFGYTLDTTWRLPRELADEVATLAYPTGIPAHAQSSRELRGVDPGMHTVAVPHAGRTVHCPQEVRAVVDLVRTTVGRQWRDGGSTRALAAEDVIVVAPYHAQAHAIREALTKGGLSGVRVGNVERFQGQEAVVVIVSMTASTPADAPRGRDYLLSRNRLTTSLSRARWATYVVHSPGLLDPSVLLS